MKREYGTDQLSDLHFCTVIMTREYESKKLSDLHFYITHICQANIRRWSMPPYITNIYQAIMKREYATDQLGDLNFSLTKCIPS